MIARAESHTVGENNQIPGWWLKEYSKRFEGFITLLLHVACQDNYNKCTWNAYWMQTEIELVQPKRNNLFSIGFKNKKKHNRRFHTDIQRRYIRVLGLKDMNFFVNYYRCLNLIRLVIFEIKSNWAGNVRYLNCETYWTL